MPPKVPAGANCLVILFDINTPLKEQALNFLTKVLYIKQLTESKDLTKVYLFNTNEGVTYLDVEEMKVDAVLQEIQNYDAGEDSFIEALIVAIDELKEFHGSVAVNFQILLITDFENCKNDNRKIPSSIIDDLKDEDIFLYVVGPNIRPNKLLIREKDLIEWKNSIQEQPDNPNLNEALKLVKKIKNSVIADFELGIHLFCCYKYNKGMQPWNVPLTIGSKLELPVSTIRITKEEAPFKIQASGRSHFVVPKWVLEDEEDKEVDFADRVSGVVRHGKFVKIETNDMFKSENPRGFNLLGFTEQVNIPEYYFQSDATYITVPDLTQPEDQTELFYILIDELAKAKLYGFARRVYNNNNEPKFYALVPRPDMKVKCFLVFALPFAEDVTYSYKEKETRCAPKIVKDEDVYNFLDSINVSSSKCKVPPGLGPTLMLDPNCIDIIKKIEEKMLHRHPEFTKKDLLPSQDEEKLFERFSNSWPQREVVKATKVQNNPIDFDENLDDFTFDD